MQVLKGRYGGGRDYFHGWVGDGSALEYCQLRELWKAYAVEVFTSSK